MGLFKSAYILNLINIKFSKAKVPEPILAEIQQQAEIQQKWNDLKEHWKNLRKTKLRQLTDEL